MAKRRGEWLGRAAAMAAVLAMVSLGGCAWRPWPTAHSGDRGFDALSAGDYEEAEVLLSERLRDEPGDPYARLNLSVVYQNTGREAEARRILVDLIAEDPAAQATRSNNAAAAGQSIAAIARRNLVLLDGRVQTDNRLNGIAVGHMNNGDWLMAGIYADAALALNRGDPYAALNRGVVAAQDGERAMAETYLKRAQELGKTAVVTRSTDGGGRGRTVAQLAEANRAQLAQSSVKGREDWPRSGARFAVLKRLRDRGLITAEEYIRRRDANLAAAVPGAGAPPEIAIDDAESLLVKLLSRYQLGDLSAEEYGALRAIVLDRVLPAAPLPALPPGEAGMEGLKSLRAAGVITDAEQKRLAARLAPPLAMAERAAPATPPQSAMRAPTATMGRSAAPTAAPAAAAPAMATQAMAPGNRLGLQLASYRRQAHAARGWDRINARAGAVLAGFEHSIVRVDLGGTRGVYYRLFVGEMDSPRAARQLCGRLRERNIDCVVGRY